MFEIIYSDNQVVVEYDFSGLVLLNAIDAEGYEQSYSNLYEIAKKMNNVKRVISDEPSSFVIVPPMFYGSRGQCLEKISAITKQSNNFEGMYHIQYFPLLKLLF